MITTSPFLQIGTIIDSCLRIFPTKNISVFLRILTADSDYFRQRALTGNAFPVRYELNCYIYAFHPSNGQSDSFFFLLLFFKRIKPLFCICYEAWAYIHIQNLKFSDATEEMFEDDFKISQNNSRYLLTYVIF
jgi:hypothetical protein